MEPLKESRFKKFFTSVPCEKKPINENVELRIEDNKTTKIVARTGDSIVILKNNALQLIDKRKVIKKGPPDIVWSTAAYNHFWSCIPPEPVFALPLVPNQPAAKSMAERYHSELNECRFGKAPAPKSFFNSLRKPNGSA